MKLNDNNLLLRITVAGILLMHSVPGMLNNGINEFGQYYLNQQGFSPLGVPLAWAIKISHVFAAGCLLSGKLLKWAGFITIAILIVGIVMVHYKEGWFVVGGGRNGVEFNILLIAALLTIMFSSQKK